MTNKIRPTKDNSFDKSVVQFDPRKLHEIFSNLQVYPNDKFSAYKVMDRYGSEAGTISHLGGHEWRVYVDNFPGQKKLFAWNIPVLTIEQFILDIERTGLHLVQHNVDVVNGSEASSSSIDDINAAQPRLTVKLVSYPESNGKRNWTALLTRVDKWDGLVGNGGGITIARGELWNRVAYEAERTRFLIGERDTEPFILYYTDDIETPEQWPGETRGQLKNIRRTYLMSMKPTAIGETVKNIHSTSSL